MFKKASEYSPTKHIYFSVQKRKMKHLFSDLMLKSATLMGDMFNEQKRFSEI